VLTRRAGVNKIEFVAVCLEILQGIILDEPKGIPGLSLVVYPDDLLETRTVVAHRSPTSPAE
jgi:hypothetical protein